MYVCLSHCSFKMILLFVSRWNRAIFYRHLSKWHSTKRCSSIFDLGPLTHKIYSAKLALWVIESVEVYMDVCHGTVGLSVHTKTCMWVGPNLDAMAMTFGLGAESSRLPACALLQLNSLDFILFLCILFMAQNDLLCAVKKLLTYLLG